jgi:hypothetical protein
MNLKESARKSFSSFINRYTLVKHSDVGNIAFRGKAIPFQNAFTILANEFQKEPDADKAIEILTRAQELFEHYMKPYAQDIINKQDNDPRFFLACYFVVDEIDMKTFKVTRESSEETLTFYEMYRFFTESTSEERESCKPWDVGMAREFMVNPEEFRIKRIGGGTWLKPKALLKQSSAAPL